MRSAAKRLLLDRDTWSPYRLANNAAVYSLDGSPSDSTYLIDGSNRLMLVADRSGNSAVNGLVLPGVTGNSASFTELTPFGTGDFTLTARVSTNAIGSAQAIISKSAGNACAFFINASGYLQTALSLVTNNTASTTLLAAFTTYDVAYVRSGTTGTYYVNGVAAGTTPDSLNYTAGENIIGLTDGPNVFFFNGCIYRVRVYSAALDAAGIVADASGAVQANIVLNSDLTAVAKLATSFVASTGQTITINTTAIALPARICGARDLYQGTQASQPIFSVSGGYNIATFDGSDDYWKSAPFSLIQPESRYAVISSVSWTYADYILDGYATNSGNLIQQGVPPNLDIYAGTSNVGNNTLAVGAVGVVRSIFNGASSQNGVNRGAAAIGNAGANAMNGVTVGTQGNTLSAFSNITISELIIRSVADDAATQLRLANYLIRKWGIAA